MRFLEFDFSDGLKGYFIPAESDDCLVHVQGYFSYGSKVLKNPLSRFLLKLFKINTQELHRNENNKAEKPEKIGIKGGSNEKTFWILSHDWADLCPLCPANQLQRNRE